MAYLEFDETSTSPLVPSEDRIAAAFNRSSGVVSMVVFNGQVLD